MKTYDEVQKQVDALENLVLTMKNLLAACNSSFSSDKIKSKIASLQSEIETLKWVLS